MSSVLVDVLPAAIGGGLIGGAAGLAMYLNGKVLGFSKLLEDITPLKKFDNKLDGVFSFSVLSGTFAAGGICYNINPTLFSDVSPNMYALMFGGALVGFGTKLGNGCTSGHGVCGLSRFSGRSFVAVSTFMTTAVTLSSTKHLWQDKLEMFQFSLPEYFQGPLLDNHIAMNIITGSIASYMLFRAFQIGNNASAELRNDVKKLIYSGFPIGAMFSSGLITSGMVRPEVVSGFLNLSPLFGGHEYGVWDPSLLAVFISAVGVNTIMHNMLSKGRKLSALSLPMRIPKRSDIDTRLIIGSAIFGVGWSSLGMCPAPAFVAGVANMGPVMLIWMPSYFIGRKLASLV